MGKISVILQIQTIAGSDTMKQKWLQLLKNQNNHNTEQKKIHNKVTT
jgi:hypothetical protein